MEPQSESKFFGKWLLFTLGGIAAAIVALVLALNFSLNAFTRHGKEIAVPDFTNMTVEQAGQAAGAAQIRVEVTDSVFIKRMGRGMVFSQAPAPGAAVKKGRLIRLTINAKSAKKVQMPDLVGYSLRQAQAELQAKGLNLGKIIYKEDIATNNVLSQVYRNREIKAGKIINSDSSIDLIVGLNKEDSLAYVPNVLGQKQLRAVTVIHDNSLNISRLSFDKSVKDYSDSLNAFVYKQEPEPSEDGVRIGSEVSLYLTVDESKLPQQK